MPVPPRVRAVRSAPPAPSAARTAHTLRDSLERLYREFDYAGRVERDAIQYPLRYADPRDREVVALLTACLAYGRVDLFGRALEGVLAAMGPAPARTGHAVKWETRQRHSAPRVPGVRGGPSIPIPSALRSTAGWHM